MRRLLFACSRSSVRRRHRRSGLSTVSEPREFSSQNVRESPQTQRPVSHQYHLLAAQERWDSGIGFHHAPVDGCHQGAISRPRTHDGRRMSGGNPPGGLLGVPRRARRCLVESVLSRASVAYRSGARELEGVRRPQRIQHQLLPFFPAARLQRSQQCIVARPSRVASRTPRVDSPRSIGLTGSVRSRPRELRFMLVATEWILAFLDRRER